jgi:succinate-acetate transporter protein
MVAFLGYGLFWESFCFLLIFPKMGWGTAADAPSLALYLFIWGVFSSCMFVATLKKHPWSLVVLFATVVILFFLLAAHFWSESEGLLKAAGIEGIICGLLAIYVAFGEILNPIYGRTIIPLGERNQPPKK